MVHADGRIGGGSTEHPLVITQPRNTRQVPDSIWCQDMSDEELCTEIRNGSTAAAESLFRRHYRIGVQFARELGAECHTAEDLGSEAFVRLWQRLGRPEPVASVPAYLRMIVRNLYVDLLRKPAPVLLDTLLDRDLLSVVDFAESVASRDAVQVLLTQLSDRYRRILELTAVLGLSPAEAAEEMGLTSAGAAAVLAHRARRAAREVGLRSA